jgi:hypothetical protein
MKPSNPQLVSRPLNKPKKGSYIHFQIVATAIDAMMTGRYPLEAKIGHRDDFCVTVDRAPFDDAGKHGQRSLMHQAVTPPLLKGGIDAEAGAFDHRGVCVQPAVGKK